VDSYRLPNLSFLLNLKDKMNAHHKHILLGLLAAALFATGCGRTQTAHADATHSKQEAPEAEPIRFVKNPDTAPAFQLNDLEGKPVSLAEAKGKVVLLNFWATWCGPCLEEIPLLMTLRRAQAARGIEIVGIAVDQAAKVGEFAAKLKIDYPILLADTGGLDLIRTLGNKSAGLPFTVFLDRAGSVARTKLGMLRQPELDSVLAALTT